MKNRKVPSFIWAKPAKIDWKLLAFLLLLLNVKLVVKVAAIILIYCLRPDFRFGFKFKESRLPLFYLFMILIAVVNWAVTGLAVNLNYDLVFASGILFWLFCILSIHQLKLSVERNDTETIHRTITAFFLINILFSLFVYGGIIWETGAINPYRYQGNYQKYFIGTGDYIKGVSFDTSTTNAVLNAFAVIYFLLRERFALAITAMAVMLLTGSNITNLLLLLVLAFIFFFRSNKDQKSIVFVCLFMLIIFLVKVSPQNNKYVSSAFQRIFKIETMTREEEAPIGLKPDILLTTEERKVKIARAYVDSVNLALFEKNRIKTNTTLASMSIAGFWEKPIIPGDSIHTPKFQHKNDTTAIEKKMIDFMELHDDAFPFTSGKRNQPELPGKFIALQQTASFFKNHPFKVITGTGMGNFSSKLAFRATSLKVTGSYPEKFAYINKDFEINHLDLYLYYFTRKDDYHSIVNSPNNTYDQLFSEYGVAGLLAFFIFYAGFFWKKITMQGYAIPLLLLMLGAFWIEYWFEQLSVVVFFELMVLLNIKETRSEAVYV